MGLLYRLSIADSYKCSNRKEFIIKTKCISTLYVDESTKSLDLSQVRSRIEFNTDVKD